ncbi:hypothetical protein E2562_032275 [Oryza meyeriana var. granulata]|uniref:Uncharacterized protein n=1 Tax=Oryza meyeriana var. granulata TaxID=110450 RepID=A0A6G1F0M2_9ORYZ|nr:hypothetical protein E2562_032275 [Oryza meyeriana var. granulata]
MRRRASAAGALLLWRVTLLPALATERGAPDTRNIWEAQHKCTMDLARRHNRKFLGLKMDLGSRQTRTPNLYKLIRRKNVSVWQELEN